ALARARRDLFGVGATDELEDPELSTEERDALLRSVGIDPDIVDESDGEEAEQIRVWSCARCATTGGSTEVTYVRGELLCRTCAEAALVEDRRGAENAEKAAEKKRAAVEASRPADPQEAALKAALYGLLFFAGIAGPLWMFADMIILSILLGGAVAGIGGSMVYKLAMDRAASA
ncbi:MAG TPA: hypothetical protein VFF73_35050, partial [Planctomycetota bacterium]|nr:hypothetical protein [Planctomycetota bacterium]